nr:HEPN domain-containing protein [Chloroflexota bacterium]
MAKEPHIRRREVALYADRARQMLVVAACNLDNAFYASAINRAYYAIFYAANAMLATQGL